MLASGPRKTLSQGHCGKYCSVQVEKDAVYAQESTQYGITGRWPRQIAQEMNRRIPSPYRGLVLKDGPTVWSLPALRDAVDPCASRNQLLAEEAARIERTRAWLSKTGQHQLAAHIANPSNFGLPKESPPAETRNAVGVLKKRMMDAGLAEHLQNGDLSRWLREVGRPDLASEATKLSLEKQGDLIALYGILFGSEDPASEQENASLREITQDPVVLRDPWRVARCQADLLRLLSRRVRLIYLMDGPFVLPQHAENVTYIGIGNPSVMLESILAPREITMKNVDFDMDAVAADSICTSPQMSYGVFRTVFGENMKLGLALAKEASENGHPRVQYMLSALHLQGISGLLEADSKEALRLATLAAASVPQASFLLGNMYAIRDAEHHDPAKSRLCYERAARQFEEGAESSAVMATNLAICYAYGYGKERNWGKARELNKRAIKLADPLFLPYLAEHFRKNPDLMDERDLPDRLRQRAQEEQPAFLLQHRDDPLMLARARTHHVWWESLLRSLSEKAGAYFTYLLASAVPLDARKAKQSYLEQAAKEGVPEAQYSLARFLHLESESPETRKITSWLELASHQGQPGASYLLAVLTSPHVYEMGEEQENALLCAKDAWNGCAPAQSLLATYYEEGFGVPIDNDAAEWWRTEAFLTEAPVLSAPGMSQPAWTAHPDQYMLPKQHV